MVCLEPREINFSANISWLLSHLHNIYFPKTPSRPSSSVALWEFSLIFPPGSVPLSASGFPLPVLRLLRIHCTSIYLLTGSSLEVGASLIPVSPGPRTDQQICGGLMKLGRTETL